MLQRRCTALSHTCNSGKKGCWRKKGLFYDASQEAIYQSSLSLNIHTHLCRLYGEIQEAFPTDRHKKGAGLGVQKQAQEGKKKEHSPTSSSSHPSFPPSPPPSTLSPWPLQYCSVPAGFQGAANGLRLIYMQLGWDTCRPSSPSNGAVQESRLNTTGDR